MLNKYMIRNGDANSLLDEMEDNTIDLVLTSPPYDELRDYINKKYKNNNYDEISKKLYKKLKEGGIVAWVVSDQTIKGSETGNSFRQALTFINNGFRLHDTMIWEKDTSSFPSKNRYNQIFEYIFIFSKGKPKTFNPIKDKKNKYFGTKIHGTYREKNGNITERQEKWKKSVVSEFGVRNNVWHIPTEKNNKTGHPAVFPETLASDIIKSFSNKGDTILDIFLGSGTSAIAALKNERYFIGFEIEKEYYNMSKKRIENTLIETNLFNE